MSFIVELKHAFGIQRDDQEQLESKVLQAYKDDEYGMVIELCSMLDWAEKPLSSDVAFALCYSIWHEPGNDSEIFEVAQKCVKFYGENRFKEICSYAQEHWGKQKLKKLLKQIEPEILKGPYFSTDYRRTWKWSEEWDNNFKDILEYFTSSLSWQHGNKNLEERIRKSKFEAYLAWANTYIRSCHDNNLGIEDDFTRNLFHGKIFIQEIIACSTLLKEAIELEKEDSGLEQMLHFKKFEIDHKIAKGLYREAGDMMLFWKERERAKITINASKNYYKLFESNQNLLQLTGEKKYKHLKDFDFSNEIREVNKRAKRIEELLEEDKLTFGKSLKDFPEASGFCNKLIKAGYNTLGDLLREKEEIIDNIPGIGDKTWPQVKSFINKF